MASREILLVNGHSNGTITDAIAAPCCACGQICPSLFTSMRKESWNLEPNGQASCVSYGWLWTMAQAALKNVVHKAAHLGTQSSQSHPIWAQQPVGPSSTKRVMTLSVAKTGSKRPVFLQGVDVALVDILLIDATTAFHQLSECKTGGECNGLEFNAPWCVSFCRLKQMAEC